MVVEDALLPRRRIERAVLGEFERSLCEPVGLLWNAGQVLLGGRPRVEGEGGQNGRGAQHPQMMPQPHPPPQSHPPPQQPPSTWVVSIMMKSPFHR
jgi:hypothetical protein